jgi:YidC/Oxa1 family membrane protein insertase
MSTLFRIPADAAYHLVSALASLLAPLFGGLAAAAAIVAFTMAVRLLLVPLSYRSMKGIDSQSKMAPRVQALREKHGKDSDALRRELTELYRAEGTSAYAGCLPTLAQWPFFSILYLVFRSPAIDGSPNALLAHDLFGAALGSHWLSGAGPFSAQGAVFAGLFLLLAGIGWLTARLASRAAGDRASGGRAPAAAIRLAPYLTAVFAAFLPLAAGLYLATTSAWTLAERAILRRGLRLRPRGGSSGSQYGEERDAP